MKLGFRRPIFSWLFLGSVMAFGWQDPLGPDSQVKPKRTTSIRVIKPRPRRQVRNVGNITVDLDSLDNESINLEITGGNVTYRRVKEVNVEVINPTSDKVQTTPRFESPQVVRELKTKLIYDSPADPCPVLQPLIDLQTDPERHEVEDPAGQNWQFVLANARFIKSTGLEEGEAWEPPRAKILKAPLKLQVFRIVKSDVNQYLVGARIGYGDLKGSLKYGPMSDTLYGFERSYYDFGKVENVREMDRDRLFFTYATAHEGEYLDRHGQPQMRKREIAFEISDQRLVRLRMVFPVERPVKINLPLLVFTPSTIANPEISLTQPQTIEIPVMQSETVCLTSADLEVSDYGTPIPTTPAYKELKK